MAAAEGFEEFLVGQHKVAPEVLQQLRAEGVESLSDFVGLFTEADYEQALKDEVLSKVESHRDSKIQLARLRVAWMRARQEVQNAAPASSLPDSSADLEAPLPAEVRQRQEDAFHSRYNLGCPNGSQATWGLPGGTPSTPGTSHFQGPCQPPARS